MGKKRTIIHQDVDTGEVLEGVLVYSPPKKYNGFEKGWLAMGQSEALDILIGFERLEDLRVFCTFLKHLDYENHISAKQVEVARSLGMQPSHVSRSVKRLLGMGAILKGSKPGFLYQLNPEFGWKGSGDNHRKALDDHRKARMRAAKITGVVKTPPADTKDPK
jgi:Firmicute plasmid replication protein (RepL)